MSVLEAARVGNDEVADAAQRLAREGFTPPGEKRFGTQPAWTALRELGTRLWLDTGDLDAARQLWTDDFSNLTTNNTLVNKEVQKGLFDELIPQSGRALREADASLSLDDLVIEVGFVVNCRTALRLVEAFDATVSVELHPAMAHDVERSVEYGRRYYAVYPERFIVKAPLTPAGFLVARRLSDDGIPVNFTLGFSARQNVLAASFSRPAYANVFLGRLNAFVADHGLGDGKNVGEKTAMATQAALREGRARRGWQTQLIGASMRSAQQLFDLAGLDVYTMPPAAAEEFLRLFPEQAGDGPLTSRLGHEYEVHAEPAAVLEPLWKVDERVYEAADALGVADASGWTGAELVQFLQARGVSDLFREWTADELAQIQEDGKIPKWERWRAELESGRLGLDDLMSVSALQSFVQDQAALDERIRRLLTDAGID